MINTENISFNNESELIHFLKAISPLEKNQITIVGGHFLVFYDTYTNSLKPLIHQDIHDIKQKEIAKLYAGDFPVQSFDVSLNLLSCFRERGIKSKIVIVVNDHKFKSENFHFKSFNNVSGRILELKKDFYKNISSFPKSYMELIENHGFKDLSEILIDNSNNKRNNNSPLPKNTYYFSEQVLRTRIDNKIRKNNILELFELGNIRNSRGNLYFDEICLTEEGKCGCSLEVIEFFLDLYAKGLTDIIFFSPSECFASVYTGLNIAFRLFGKKNEKIRITLISGIGDLYLNKDYKIKSVTIRNF